MDFVLAFPQAKVHTDIYMHVPEKFSAKNGKLELDEQAPHPSKQRAVVKLIQNVYETPTGVSLPSTITKNCKQVDTNANTRTMEHLLSDVASLQRSIPF